MSPRKRIYHNRYEILRLIDKGGSATVYHVRDVTTPLTKTFAMKVVRKIGNTNLLDQYRGERDLLDKLAHQNITSILDYFEDDEYCYIVMNYVQGNSLKKILKHDGPRSEEEVIGWAKTLCDVLSYLHSQGIAYCDMGPKNVMLDESGNLHLLDFGICEPITGRRSNSQPLGTKGFSAPEQYANGSRIIDERTDVYALGATIYNLLTGEVVTGQESYENISPALSDIIKKAVNAEPSKRYQNTKEMKKALSSVHEVTKTYQKKVRRNLFSVLACFLLTIVLGTLSFISYGQISAQKDSLYSAYIAQANSYMLSNKFGEAQTYYLKAAEVKPEESETYRYLYDLLRPKDASASWEAQEKAAIDVLRLTSSPSYLDTSTLKSALLSSVQFTEPVYRDYAEHLVKELNKRKEDSEELRLAEYLLSDKEVSADTVLEGIENLDAKTSLDAYYAASILDSSYVPKKEIITDLEKNAQYTRSVPMKTLFASRSYEKYKETSDKTYLNDASFWIHSYDGIYNKDSQILKAKIDFDRKNYAGAKAVYRQILKDDPENVTALTGLMNTVVEEQSSKPEKNYSEAMDAYNKLSKSTALPEETLSFLKSFQAITGGNLEKPN